MFDENTFSTFKAAGARAIIVDVIPTDLEVFTFSDQKYNVTFRGLRRDIDLVYRSGTDELLESESRTDPQSQHAVTAYGVVFRSASNLPFAPFCVPRLERDERRCLDVLAISVQLKLITEVKIYLS